MTERNDAGLTAAQLDRVAQLRARRGQTPPSEPPPDGASTTSDQMDPAAATNVERGRKRHVAQGGRMVAAGLGATTMFGIVGVLGLGNSAATNDAGIGAVTPVVQNPAPPPIQVVVHRIPATRTTAPSQPAERTSDDTVSTSAPGEPPAAPIVLTAQPVVQTVTVAAPSRANAPAPAATTRGSN